MFENLSAIILIVVWLVVFIVALAYYQYYAWFRPEKFKSNQVKNVKDWWPFPKLFRSWFNSPAYLWLVRIVFGLALLATIIMVSVAILGYLNIIP